MNYYIYFSISAIFYLLLLTIVFFTKKRVKLLENNVYIILVFLTLIGIGMELLLVYKADFLNDHILFKSIVSKGFLVVQEFWVGLLSLYTFMFTRKVTSENFNEFVNKIFLHLLPIAIILVVTCWLPIEYKYSETLNTILYTYGHGTKMVFVAGVLYIGLSIYYVLNNSNNVNVKDKRLIPVYVYIIVSIPANLD